MGVKTTIEEEWEGVPLMIRFNFYLSLHTLSHQEILDKSRKRLVDVEIISKHDDSYALQTTFMDKRGKCEKYFFNYIHPDTIGAFLEGVD